MRISKIVSFVAVLMIIIAGCEAENGWNFQSGESDSGDSDGGSSGSGGVSSGSDDGSSDGDWGDDDDEMGDDDDDEGSSSGGSSSGGSSSGGSSSEGSSGGGSSSGSSCNPGYEDANPSNRDYSQESKGSKMYAGADCTACHSSITVAGTLYRDPDGDTPVNGATVEVVDARGVVLSLVSNSAGNFYSTATVTPPLSARVWDSGNEVSMGSTFNSGACNACHACSGSVGAKIYLP